MKVCLVAEGCYPYVVGGVSSWIHSMISSFPNIEFIVLAIVADRSLRGKFKYELPVNVTAVHELYLNDQDWYEGKSSKRHRGVLRGREYQAFYRLLLNEETDWDILFELFCSSRLSINDLLMGEAFLSAAKACYEKNYSNLVFSDFLWTLRSMYLPLFQTLRMKVPEADLYHCVATGYAGVLGCMARHFHGCRLLVSEHGIYTREREEELIKANWVKGVYKDVWIEQFRKMSRIAYQKADLVTSLYEYARQLQVELGCPASKTMVTPNGIDVKRFADLPGKTQEEEAYIQIGAVLRVAPIKDVKTLIQAFYIAKERNLRLKLWIMGPVEEEEEYARECFEMVEILKIPDVIFTGRVDIREYLGRMDFTILTSISEGQPLTILESYAAKKPVIATDVGNCSGLIFGENDNFGPAGILTHIMNIEEISQAILELANHPQKRAQMGQAGYRRLMSRYKIEDMKAAYEKIYRDFSDCLKPEETNILRTDERNVLTVKDSKDVEPQDPDTKHKDTYLKRIDDFDLDVSDDYDLDDDYDLNDDYSLDDDYIFHSENADDFDLKDVGDDY